jgi:hypothetical protein
MPTVEQTRDSVLAGITGAFPAAYYQLGKDDGLDPVEYPLAQIIEHLDGKICPLCRSVHGKIVAKGTPEWVRWRLPSHINCRRITVDIHKDEVDNEGNPTRPDFVEPEADLVKRHGHFVNDPKKYEALRVPARPTGRDFIVRRLAGQSTELIFARALPEGLLKATLRTIGNAIITETINNGPGQYAAQHARILQQCARQGANRQYWDHLPLDLDHHADDWGVANYLSEREYRSVPGAVLDGAHDTSILLDQSTDYGEMPLVWFRADGVRVGRFELDEVDALWDVDRSAFYHVGRLRRADLAGSAEFTPLTGDW